MNGKALIKRVSNIFHPMVMGILAIGTVPLLLLDRAGTLSPVGKAVVSALDWTVVAFFFGEYTSKLVLAKSRWQFVRSPWRLLDLLIIILPFVGLGMGLRSGSNYLASSPMLRLLRLGRALIFATKGIRELQLHQTLLRNRFYHMAGATLLIYFAMATVFYVVENNASHHLAYADAIWWGVGYISTIGSEVVPSTGTGRILGALLMTVGLGFAGVFTANIVSYIQDIHHTREDEEASAQPVADVEPVDTAEQLLALDKRLSVLEAKVDRLLVLSEQNYKR